MQVPLAKIAISDSDNPRNLRAVDAAKKRAPSGPPQHVSVYLRNTYTRRLVGARYGGGIDQAVQSSKGMERGGRGLEQSERYDE